MSGARGAAADDLDDEAPVDLPARPPAPAAAVEDSLRPAATSLDSERAETGGRTRGKGWSTWVGVNVSASRDARDARLSSAARASAALLLPWLFSSRARNASSALAWSSARWTRSGSWTCSLLMLDRYDDAGRPIGGGMAQGCKADDALSEAAGGDEDEWREQRVTHE